MAEERWISIEDLRRWIEKSYKPAWDEVGITVDEKELISSLRTVLAEKTIRWRHCIAILVSHCR